jgi:hypothetical protein
MVVDGVGADGGAEVAGRVIETILALLEAGASTGLSSVKRRCRFEFDGELSGVRGIDNCRDLFLPI